MEGEPWRWSACDLAHAIRTRRISSREAVASCLARLDRVNPRLNAVVDVLREEALSAAAAADRALAQGDEVGPLHGVPVTIKINVDYTGRPTTNGVVAFRDRIAPADSPPVANWRRAGAIVIGRTNVPMESEPDAGRIAAARQRQWQAESARLPTATIVPDPSGIRLMHAASQA